MGKNLTAHPSRPNVEVCSIELMRDLNLPPAWWEVVVTIPGRDRPMRRRWVANGALMSPSQIEDLLGWIQLTVGNSIALTASPRPLPGSGA